MGSKLCVDLLGSEAPEGTGGQETVRISPDLIPAADYDVGCRVLAASIRHALADPVLRAQYEEWKRQKAG